MSRSRGEFFKQMTALLGKDSKRINKEVIFLNYEDCRIIDWGQGDILLNRQGLHLSSFDFKFGKNTRRSRGRD